ncbi:hypothetical protein ACVIU7_009436 [Bradyrhizobium liaoningense]
MDKSSVFDIALRRYGGRLHIPALDSETAQVYAAYSRYFDGALKWASATNAHCDWVDNFQFNALATVARGHELIGMFSGIVIRTQQYFYCFLSDPSVLASIGNASSETPNVASLRSLGLQDPTIYARARAPTDPKRKNLADALTVCTVMCIFFHELAHTTRCHLPFYREVIGATSYLELPATELTPEESRLRILLELDADHFGAFNHLGFWRMLYEGLFGLSPIPLTAEECWCISVTMSFFIMGSFARRSSEHPSHPPPAMRYLHLINRALSQEHGMYVGPHDVATKGFKTVSDWWISNERPRGIRQDALSEEMFEELQALLREFEFEYWPKLETHIILREKSIAG